MEKTTNKREINLKGETADNAIGFRIETNGYKENLFDLYIFMLKVYMLHVQASRNLDDGV